jgi:WD40 repeat protein
VDTLQELLRVTVRNHTCSKVVFAPDGTQIVTAWCDGRIRSFAPETGRPLYTIENCHNDGVSVVAVHLDGQRLLSGGGDGRVCVWLVENGITALVAVLKDHKGKVSAIAVHRRGDRILSSSVDGTCVIWDITRYVRLSTIFSNTVLTDVQYHPNDLEIIMCGTNGYIGYWDAIDGSPISKIETFSGSSLNSLDVTPAGSYHRIPPT